MSIVKQEKRRKHKSYGQLFGFRFRFICINFRIDVLGWLELKFSFWNKDWT